MANAINFIINEKIEEDLLNVGSGQEITIEELVNKIKKVINYEGNISFDSDMPDGNPRKLLDSSKINSLGWEPKIDLDKGLENTYSWYLDNKN